MTTSTTFSRTLLCALGLTAISPHAWSQTGPAPLTPPAGYVMCATEWQSCSFTGVGEVIYGANRSWTAPRRFSSSVACTNAVFGDPIAGTLKSCYVRTVTATPTPTPTPTPVAAYPNLWNYQQINIQNAVAVSNRSPYAADPTKKIRIAIIDSGFSRHPDIAWATDANRNVLALSTDNGATTGEGLGVKHSLHVAGIIGGINYMNRGRVGMCPQCEILSVKYAPPASVNPDATEDEHMGRAIRMAVDNGAKAINISIAGGGVPERHRDNGLPCTSTPLTRAAVEYAAQKNVSIVASAGNWGRDDASANGQLIRRNVALISPASCPGVISVGASDQSGSIANRYSNHGGLVTGPDGRTVSSLTLLAPGGGATDADGLYGNGLDGVFGNSTEVCDAAFTRNRLNQSPSSTVQIFSAWGSGSLRDGNAKSCYRYLGGTSMAASHVTGVVGLMLSVQPNLSTQDVKSILMSTATSVDGTAACQTGGPGHCGSGLLNAYAAVQKAKVTVPQAPPGTGPCSYKGTASQCKLDVMAFDTSLTQVREETVMAYGKMWKYDAAGNVLQGAVDLRSIPRYASGPCAWAPAGQPCVVDSLTIVNHPDYGYVESVTAYGRAWNFWRDGTEVANLSNFDLKTIPRYGTGGFVPGGSNPTPCGPSGSQPCKFDTREIVDARDRWGDLFEGITAYGSYFIFRWDGTFVESRPLLTVPRYAAGPCKYRSGSTCTFDTSEKKRVNGKIVEVITAYGRYWEFEDGSDVPLPGSDVELTKMARFR